MHACSNRNCFVNDGESCTLGRLSPEVCENWQKVDPGEKSADALASSTTRVPWSGSAFGLSDIVNLSVNRRPILIGLLGARDAGKTTLLVGTYLQMLAGKQLGGADFSSCLTFGAWESMAAWVRIEDAARRPSFPPHTPRGTGRVPGLLHLGIRRPTIGRQEMYSSLNHRDVLLADAPGEWFTRWSVKEDAPDAEGARWVAEHADAFLVFADCDRLSGPDRGTARNELRQLIERLGNHVGRRPTILVWAKNDIEPPTGIQTAVRSIFQQQIPQGVELKSTTKHPETLLSVISDIVSASWSPTPMAVRPEAPLICKPFEAFRGENGHA